MNSLNTGANDKTGAVPTLSQVMASLWLGPLPFCVLLVEIKAL